ncbi:MAG: serine hydroxymethyltransferase [Candidatus Heimdallarchaeota archaeon]|nr:serine hydroxymethyltransferase [Candidatus Heimdallarchaeota archaeon]
MSTKEMNKKDPEISNLIDKELIRQKEVLNLIPSENYASEAVLEACGSILSNKYSEGYPFKRYYQGNANADEVEKLAIDRVKKLFGAEHANVQPLSGSPANFAVFLAFLKPGDKFMGLDLACGGHLTHGSHVNFSGKIYTSIPYPVNKETHLIDMEQVREIALRERPKLIISGLTAYPRTIDFQAFQNIANEVGAIHLADVSHIAGLIAAKVIPSPLPFTDIVMFTTHKTLRGPRGGVILCKEKFAKDIDRAVFPGCQGGPHDNLTAAKAVCFKEALQPEFQTYSYQVLKNAKELANTLIQDNIKLITGGTDNHLILIDLLSLGIGMGKSIAVALENANICTNANSIPFDPSTPFKPSGLRLGTPVLTTRGMKEDEMRMIGNWMSDIIKDHENVELQDEIREKVKALCGKFGVYGGL